MDGGRAAVLFADKNFKNEPKRCKACKSKRASRPAGGGGAARGTGGNRDHVLGLREGDDGALQADAGPPVFCKECFQSRKFAGAGGI